MKRINRVALVSTIVMGAPVFQSLAQSAGVDTDAAYACVAIEDDLDRLACYDAAIGQLKAAEDAGEVTVVTREDIEAAEQDSFGLAERPAPAVPAAVREQNRPDPITSIHASVTAIRRNLEGNLVVTLDNGQIWRQTDTARVTYSERRGVETAEVKRAALGSFRMKLDGGRPFRVKRVQ